MAKKIVRNNDAKQVSIKQKYEIAYLISRWYHPWSGKLNRAHVVNIMENLGRKRPCTSRRVIEIGLRAHGYIKK